MPKVDEHARVGRLGAAAIARLAAALDGDHVVAAALFGSQASGRATELSDVDVAVWLDPARPHAERSERRLELAGRAAAALHTGEIDLVVLNDAPPLLRHRVAREGRRILDRDPRLRVRLETAALLEYLDTAPLRRTLADGRRRRMAEGRFGRR